MNNTTTIVPSASSESARFALEIRGRLGNDEIVIAVEGNDDVRVNRKLFKKNVTLIRTYGKVRLLNIDRELFDLYPRNLIAIKDADFDHLNGTGTPHENIFLTDKHDMEMTMIDEEIADSILAEQLKDIENFDKICSGRELIETLTINLREYSYIKWLNDVCGCNINFGVVTMHGLGAASSPIHIETALEALYNNEANDREEVKKVSEEDVITFVEKHPCEDLALLVCGHDFCSSMLEWMKGKGVKNNVTRSGLEGMIRMLYSSQKFRTTKLYSGIHAWETKYGRLIVA